jgi:hypothetical protein
LKKSYIKPAIAFESLAVTANVSSGCYLLGTNSAEYVCPVIDEESGWTIFSNTAQCMFIPGPNDTICYDIPLANSNVFSS